MFSIFLQRCENFELIFELNLNLITTSIYLCTKFHDSSTSQFHNQLAQTNNNNNNNNYNNNYYYDVIVTFLKVNPRLATSQKYI